MQNVIEIPYGAYGVPSNNEAGIVHCCCICGDNTDSLLCLQGVRCQPNIAGLLRPGYGAAAGAAAKAC